MNFITTGIHKLACVTANSVLWLVKRLFRGLQAFDIVFVCIALAIEVAVILVLYGELKRPCMDPVVVTSFVALMLLFVSITVSLIRSKGNRAWPILLMAFGTFTWCLSVAVGPAGINEFSNAYMQLKGERCVMRAAQ